MDPVTLGILGGILGLGKGVGDTTQQDRDATLAAATARYSPWTGMKPQPVKKASVIGDILSGGLSGAAFGQALQTLGLADEAKNGLNLGLQAPKGANLLAASPATASFVGAGIPTVGSGLGGNPWLNLMPGLTQGSRMLGGY